MIESLDNCFRILFFPSNSKWRTNTKLQRICLGMLFLALVMQLHESGAIGYRPSANSCNRTRTILTEKSGKITDGPNDYPKESHCEWLIRAESPNYFITLNITSLDTECSYDHLYVHDGATYSSYLLAVFSGKSTSPPVIAESGEMLIMLYSDTNYMRSGFEAEYIISECPLNCSNKGKCMNHKCECNEDFTGIGCEIEVCPEDCGFNEGRGTCTTKSSTQIKTCVCEDDYSGDGCSLKSNSFNGDSWYWIYRNGYNFDPRTSHGTVYFPQLDKIYVYGGYNLNKVFDDLLVYSFNDGTWTNLKQDKAQLHSSRKRRIYSHRRIEILPPLQLYLDPNEHLKGKEASRSHNYSFSVSNNNTVSVKLISASDFPSLRRSLRMIQPNKDVKYKRQRKHNVWPAPRFGHCVESFGTNFASYGGKLDKGEVSGELWLYNTSLQAWTLISDSREFPNDQSFPPPLLYCTLTLVDGVWLYLFGGSLSHGEFSNAMYRISPSHGWIWEKVETYGGNPLKARLVGHSAAFHEPTRSLYIYGGIKVNIARFSKLSDQLLVFNVDKQYWSEIDYPKGSGDSQYFPAPLERAFHSAHITGNYMVVYGGYMHKHKEEEACYDRKIYLFHLGCHVWLSPELTPSQEKADGDLRAQGVYGHGAFLRHGNTLVIVGGFHGTVTNHVLAYVLPTTIITPEGKPFNIDEACKELETQSSCVSNMECGWCSTVSICYDRSKSANCTTNLQTSTCPGLCPTLSTCQSCLAQGGSDRGEKCSWCVKARACYPRDSTTAGQRSCGSHHHQQSWWGAKDELVSSIEDCVSMDIPPGLTFTQYKVPVNYSQPDYVSVISDIGKDLKRPGDSREPQELQTGFPSEFRLKGFLHPRYMEYISHNKLYQGMEPIRLFLEGYKLNATLHLSTDESEEKLQRVAATVAGKIPSSEATRHDGEPLIPNLSRLLLQLDIVPIQLGSNSSFNLSLLWSLGSNHPSSLSMQHLEPFGKGGSTCLNYSSCLACLSDYLCSWCSASRSCVSRNRSDASSSSCDPNHFPIIDTSQCEQCEDFIYCNDCVQTGYCEWLVEKAHCTRKGRYQTQAIKEVDKCHYPCHSRTTCAACLGDPGLCAWCEATKECFLFSLYTSVYQYGACRVWIDEDHTNATSIHKSAKLLSSLREIANANGFKNSSFISSFFSDDTGECQICESHKTCSECLEAIGCGWCYSEFNPTIGLCTSGDFAKPHKGNCTVLMENIPVPWTNNASLSANEQRVISWTYASCPDVDECMLNLHDCHPNATCINTEGAFNCSCPRGFTGNGRTTCKRTCYEVCVHGKCSGSPDYLCECNLGWIGSDCSINCGCNNHSKCQRVGFCDHCQGETTGDACELCRPGSYGNATTVGCEKCDCNGHWDEERGRCDQTTGRCFCIHNTRGHKCDKCEEGFYGDPRNDGRCYRKCTARGIIVNATKGYFGSESSAVEPLDTCLWILSAHDSIDPPLYRLKGSHVLQVTIDTIDIDCQEGSLYIYEGLPDFVSVKRVSNKQKLIGTYCSGHASFPSTSEAKSGVMTIFYEMRAPEQGFTASYEVLSCPENPGVNRDCVLGKPVCIEGRTGVRCDISICPNKCSEGHGRCDLVYGRCICNDDFVGQDCGIVREDHLVVLQELFNPLKISPSLSHLQTVLPRFGHTLIVDHQGSLWVFGGYSLSRGPLNDVLQFNTRNKTWVQVTVNVNPGAQPPSQRYFHASSYVVNKNKMFIYGGMNKTNFLKDFWTFNIATESWTQLSVIENLPGLAGHTLTFREETPPQSLILIGGVSSEHGLLEEVWEFDLLRFSWQKLESSGAKPVGIFGHSSVYHKATRSFYVYGGYSFKQNSLSLNPYLYVFDYDSKRWSILPPDGKINHNPASRPAPRAFHAAVTTEEYMVLVGGYISDRLNSNQDLMVYSYKCNMWIPLNNHFITVVGHQLSPPLLGVSATMYESSIYIIGGFSGSVDGSVVEMTIPKDLCTLNANKTQCQDRIGCANCVVHNDSGTNTSYCYSNTLTVPRSCLSPRGSLTSKNGIQCDATIFETRECYQYKTCAECLAYWPAHKNAKQRCQWCLTCPEGKCISKQGNCLEETSCPTPFKYLQTGPPQTTDLSKCPDLICAASDCEKCLDLGQCSWAQRRFHSHMRNPSAVEPHLHLMCVKQSLRNSSSEESGWISHKVCPKRCHYRDSCNSCLNNDTPSTAVSKCHWSPTLWKCLSPTSIALQCLGGTCGHLLSKSSQCPPPCTSYSQCNQCLSQAQCGWCAIESLVGGLGICTRGRLEEPLRGSCRDLNYQTIAKNESLLSLHGLNSSSTLLRHIKSGEKKTSWHYGSCPPENECLNQHHLCNTLKEVCLDQVEGYKCDCASGYRMSEAEVCEPICEQGCKHGTCIEPNNCKCNFGYVGADCSIMCQCNGHSDCRGPNDLTSCKKCYNNTMGPQCQRCEKNFVGNPQKNEKCKSCQEYCYGHTSLCTSKEVLASLNISHNFVSMDEINAAHLTEGPLTDAVCVKCGNMTEGPRCNTCLPGYFRGTTNRSVPCRPCQCNGHGSVCDPDWGINCDCKNNTETPCNGRVRGGVPGKDDEKDCWARQCSKCKEAYFGNPTNGHQCYRQMTLENEYCLDPITQNECHSVPSPLPKGKTIFFAVQPKFNNVDIRLFLDISQGGVDVFFTTFPEGYVVSVNESSWTHKVNIDTAYPIAQNDPPPPPAPFDKSKLLSPRYDLIGASAYLSKLTAQRLFANHSGKANRIAPQYYKHVIRATGLKTYFTLYDSNHFLVVKNLTDRLVVTLPKQNHNLSEAKFYVVLFGVGDPTESDSYGAIYFRQDQPRIDLFVFFSVFFSCFFLFLAVCVVAWKIKQGVDQRRARRRHVVEMLHMAKRPFSSTTLVLHVADVDLGNGTGVVAPGGEVSAAGAASATTDATVVWSPARRKRTQKRERTLDHRFDVGPVAVEPTDDGVAAVVTIVIQLPGVAAGGGCGEEGVGEAPSQRLALGSTLCLVSRIYPPTSRPFHLRRRTSHLSS